LKALLRAKAQALVQRAEERPVMLSYAADATSLKINAQSSMMLQGARVTRRGKSLVEFLLQRGILYAPTVAGEVEASLLVADPSPLREGKTAWHDFAACCSFYPLLRKAKPTGLVVTHVCCDRAVLSALARALQHRRKAYYHPTTGPALGPQRALLQQTDLMVSTGCGAHDVHNGLRWCLAPFGSLELLSALHISIVSLRNSFQGIVAALQPFLVRYLAFRPCDPNLRQSARTSGRRWTPQWIFWSRSPTWTRCSRASTSG
jgi:hypothetical protein